MAQVGLCVMAFYGLFYTVIPLYQKAALDEEIAKKTALLRHTEKSLADTYASLRNYVARNATFYPGAQCTGLLVPPHFSRPRAAGEKSDWEEILDIPSGKCLTDAGESDSKLKMLSSGDQAYFLGEVKKAALEIDRMRLAARAKCEALAKRPETVPALPPPTPGSFAAEMEYILKRAGMQSARTPQNALREAQFQIATQYGEDARARILQLGRVSWPAESQSQDALTHLGSGYAVGYGVQ